MKIKFNAQVTISVVTEVEAKNATEAYKIARERSMMELCHQCANADSKIQWVTSGELDGEPFIVIGKILEG